MASIKQLHVPTPLIKSNRLSFLSSPHDIFLKMESAQLTGSFKLRGIGYHASKCVAQGCKKFVGCSGGNAGHALAYAAKQLNVPCTVYVPTTTARMFIDWMEELGADVTVHGTNFNACSEKARKESEATDISFVHAYDHPEIWEGHSTIVQEIAEQINVKPSLIVTSVGGGGLLSGILLGLQKVGWADVPVLGMETLGAHCFNLSVKANKIIPLENITSIACLGARTIPEQLFDKISKFKVLSEVVTDAEAVSSCLKFSDDENVIVEPSCGAALSAVYFGIIEKLLKQQRLVLTDGPIVIIVCGGRGASLEMLHNWAKDFKINDHNEHV